MSENKKKYAYWMKPSMVEEITEMLDDANATSKSDFVCQTAMLSGGRIIVGAVLCGIWMKAENGRERAFQVQQKLRSTRR